MWRGCLTNKKRIYAVFVRVVKKTEYMRGKIYAAYQANQLCHSDADVLRSQ